MLCVSVVIDLSLFEILQYAHKLAMLTGQHLGAQPKPDMDQKLYYL